MTKNHKTIIGGITVLLVLAVASATLLKPDTNEGNNGTDTDNQIVDTTKPDEDQTPEVETPQAQPEDDKPIDPPVEDEPEKPPVDTPTDKPADTPKPQPEPEVNDTPVKPADPTPPTPPNDIVITNPNEDVIPQSAEQEAKLAFDSRVANGCPVCGSTTCATFDYDKLTVDSSRCDQYSEKTNPALYCQICGKENGDGTHGTCCTPMWDTTCYNCGEEIHAGECHTCN